MKFYILQYLKNCRTITKGWLIISTSIFLFVIFFVFSYRVGGSVKYYDNRWGIVEWILDDGNKSLGYIPLKFHLAICLVAVAFGTSLVIIGKLENNPKNLD